MAAVTLTSGYPKLLGTLGELSLYLYMVTDVDDTETLDTGLSERVVSHWVEWTGNPGTQTSGGGHSAESAGTITFYPSTDNLGANVFVLASGM